MAKSAVRVSFEQKKVLLKFMEEHLDFAQGKILRTKGAETNTVLWEELCTELNSVLGPKKTIKKWQKVWTDLKNKIKTKANLVKCQRGATGGGIIDNPAILTEFEEKIISLMAIDAVYGLEDTMVPLDSEMAEDPSQERNDHESLAQVETQQIHTSAKTIGAPTSGHNFFSILPMSLLPGTTDYLSSGPTSEREEEIVSTSIRGKKRRQSGESTTTSEAGATPNIEKRRKLTSAKAHVHKFISLATNFNKNLENIEAKMEDGNNKIFAELKKMNTFMERIALSLESINNKFK